MKKMDGDMPYRNRKLFELVENQADGNVSVFAKMIGKSQQVINRLFKPDKRNGKYPTVTNDIEKAVMEKFNLDESFFMRTFGGVTETPKKPHIDPDTVMKKIKEAKEEEEKERTRPRLPIKVVAGHISDYYNGILQEQCEQVPIIRQFPSYDFSVIVRGDSMEPKFEGGDELCLKRVEKNIEPGRAYLIDTNDGAFLKRLYIDEEGNRVKCSSYNPEYQDFYIDMVDIQGIYKIVGLVRFGF